MPGHVADRLAALLAERGRVMTGARVIVVGLAYKPDIADARHSPAIGVIHELESRGAQVLVHDPLATGIIVDGSCGHPSHSIGSGLRVQSGRCRRRDNAPFEHRLRCPGRAGGRRARHAERAERRGIRPHRVALRLGSLLIG